MLTFILSPIGRYVASAVAILAVLGVVAAYLINKGEDRALESVRKQDAVAAETAIGRRALVADCYALGLDWDQTTGKCQEARP